jgi:hypothetical protein
MLLLLYYESRYKSAPPSLSTSSKIFLFARSWITGPPPSLSLMHLSLPSPLETSTRCFDCGRLSSLDLPCLSSSLLPLPRSSAGHFVRFSSPPLSLRVVPLQVHALLLSTPGSISFQVLILLRALILLHTHRSDLSLLLIGSPDRALWRPPAPTLLPLVHGSQGGAIGFVRNYLQLHLCHFLILAFQ